MRIFPRIEFQFALDGNGVDFQLFGKGVGFARAFGKSFLGQPVERSRVLYCSLELPASGIRKRLDEMCSTHSQFGSLQEIYGPWLRLIAPTADKDTPPLDLTHPDDRKQLGELVVNDFDVVILDTLAKFVPLEQKDDLRWHDFMRDLNAFAREYKVGILCLDHTHRGRALEDAAQAIGGNQAKARFPAMIARLAPANRVSDLKEKIFELQAKGWYGESPTLYYRIPLLDDGSLGVGTPLRATVVP